MLGVTIPEMPIAIASIVPALILFVLTLGHMIFYGFVEYVSNRAKNLDFKKLENAVELNLKNKSVNTQYTTSQFKDIGEILNIAKLSIDSSSDISEKSKFKNLIDTITALQNGEVLEKVDNGLYLKEMNRWNELKKNSYSAEEILMEKGYSDELYVEAFNHLCQVNTLSTIERYEKWMSMEAFFHILERVDKEDNGIALSLETLFKFSGSLTFSKENYTKMAKRIRKGNMSPDMRIEFFKTLSENSEDAFEGYIYTLLNLEMVNEAEELIADSQSQDLNHIQAYVTLKKNNFSVLDMDFFFK
jgi:hypothetical protein